MSSADMSWLLDFDPTAAVEEGKGGGDYEPIPEGTYEFEINKISAVDIDNERATGTRLSVELAIKSEGFGNRKVFDSIIVRYVAKPGSDAEKAAKTQQIGRAKFGSLCIAAGLSKATDLDLLTGKFVRAEIKIREYNGKRSNEVKGAYQAPIEFKNPTRPMSNESSPWQ